MKKSASVGRETMIIAIKGSQGQLAFCEAAACQQADQHQSRGPASTQVLCISHNADSHSALKNQLKALYGIHISQSFFR